MEYVIIGAGPAGVIAAETLRKESPDANITLIGAEAQPPYSRMAIPYMLIGKIEETGTYLRKADGHYKNADITYVQDAVTALSEKNKTLTLASGKTVKFDKLLIATGAHPIKPPVPGLDLDGVHHCWTLEDAHAIAARAKKGADVVLMGAGFIGCIILEALALRGVNLTVVEAEDRMIPKMMDSAGGDMLKRWCEQKGVQIKTSTKVTGVAADGARLNVQLDKGGAVAADLVVVATGVAPNASFLQGSSVKIEDGICVDDHLQSSVADIYAAGDVAKGPDISGGFMVHAIQPTSADHGRIAAMNMAGHDVAYSGSLIMNVLDTLGLISASFGHWQGGDDEAVMSDEENFAYIKLAFDGDRLVGALSLGRTDHIGTLRGLIQSGVALGPWKTRLKKNPARIAEAYVACVHQA